MTPANELALVREAQLIYNRVSGFKPVRGMLYVWEGRFPEYPNILIRMVLPREFPTRPPVIRIESKRPLRHPNIDERTGTLRIGILRRWNSSYHAYQVLLMSRELLKRIPPVFTATPTIPTIAQKKIVPKAPQPRPQPRYQPTTYRPPTTPQKAPPQRIPTQRVPTTPQRVPTTVRRVPTTPQTPPVRPVTRPTPVYTQQRVKSKEEIFSDWVKQHKLPSLASLKKKLTKKTPEANRERILKFLYGKNGLYWKTIPQAEGEPAEFLDLYFRDLHNIIKRTPLNKFSRNNILDLVEDVKESLEKEGEYTEDLDWADKVVFTDLPQNSWSLFYNLESPIGLFFMPREHEREKYFIAQYLKILDFELEQDKRSKEEKYPYTLEEIRRFIEVTENIDAVEYLQWVRNQDLINIWRLVKQIQVLDRSRIRLAEAEDDETSDTQEFILDGIWSIFDPTRKRSVYNIRTEPEKYHLFVHYMFQLQVHLLGCVRSGAIAPELADTYLDMITKSQSEFSLEILSGRRKPREVTIVSPIPSPTPIPVAPPLPIQKEEKQVIEQQPVPTTSEEAPTEIKNKKEIASPEVEVEEQKVPAEKEPVAEKEAVAEDSVEEEKKKKKKIEEEKREWEQELEAA
ncbi:MAG: ubiquitin-conjugating enzyme E2 [Promethearchaeota archaeon]